MKKWLTFITVSVALLAEPSQPRLFSPIGAATNEAIDVSPQPCDARCLARLLKEEKEFSFLARYNNANDDGSLSAEYQRLAAFLNLSMPQVNGERIAVLIPSESIGRYSVIVSNSVSAYLLSKGKPFEMRVFDSADEKPESLENAVKEIEAAGFNRALAALTVDGARTIASMNPTIELYIPTVNRNEIIYAPNNLYFGGIDYPRQLEALSQYANRFRTFVLSEPSALSQKITAAADAILPTPASRVTLDNPRVNFSQLFKTHKIGAGASILLNTQPVRTSMALSQITFNDIRIASALSTQMNYNPLLLTLPQSDDVKNLYIANAIGPGNMTLRDINQLLRNDLRFDWTAYASSAMAAMISQRNGGDYSPRVELFGLELEDNQIQYPIKIYQIKNARFVLASPPPEGPVNQLLPPIE